MYSNKIATVLAIAAFAACNNPEKAQERANEARTEAREQTDQAQRDAEQKRLTAQAEADRKQREATLVLASAKADYKTRLDTLVADIDGRIADLKAKNAKTSQKMKAANNDRITTLAEKRSVLENDLRQLERATANDWTQVKEQLDKDIERARVDLATSVVGKL